MASIEITLCLFLFITSKSYRFMKVQKFFENNQALFSFILELGLQVLGP